MPRASANLAAKADHVAVMDGLRGLAIVLVAWYHIWQISWLEPTLQVLGVPIGVRIFAGNGFVGVEFFFLVSGFCLFYPHARHLLEGRPLPSLRTYFHKRAIKILPSYWLAIAAICGLFRPSFKSALDALWQVASHLLFIHNVSYDTEQSINGVFWSLAVEVQFYLIFPLLARAFRRWPAATPAFMAMAAIGYRALIMRYFHGNDRFLLDQLPGYLDVFAGGMVAAYSVVWLRQRADLARRMLWPMTAIALLSGACLVYLFNDLFLAHFRPDWPMAWQANHRICWALVFSAFAISSQFAHKAWRAVLANPVLVFLSGISYNLYIWHQFLARQLREHRLPNFSTADPHQDNPWQWRFTLLAWALSLALGYLLTRWWERPFLARGWGAFWPRRPALAAPQLPTPEA